MDVYEYIMKGKFIDDICLLEGDVVLVFFYENLVGILGKVKRLMIYEMKYGESLVILIGYMGGFIGDVYWNMVCLVCCSGREK